MRPVLFELGPLTVHSYGALMAVAGLAAWLVVRHELRRRSDRREAAGAVVLAAVVGGFVGARLYYAAEHAGHLGPWELASAAGFTWYGGVLGGAAAVLLVAWRQRLPLGSVVAAAALALPLAYGIGRVGCQLAGDGTYGVASDLPWAMSYPEGEVPTAERVHPTPVYETLASLLIFAGLWKLRDRLAPARLFGLYLLLAGVERFLVEFVRRNNEVLLGLTQPQVFAGAFVGVGLVLLLARRPRPHPSLAGGTS